ncbi:MAG: acyl-CoA-binding protein [Deltaproteobacteria bacterium]|nr:acyl-CoA-binding protein [Deltaproteobacteria bacterium]
MATEEEFEQAVERSRALPSTPTTDQLLALYGLYKQASVGDVQGKRPGMFDLKGRAKYDAWAKQKAKTSEEARAAYIALVDSLAS